MFLPNINSLPLSLETIKAKEVSISNIINIPNDPVASVLMVYFSYFETKDRSSENIVSLNIYITIAAGIKYINDFLLNSINFNGIRANAINEEE